MSKMKQTAYWVDENLLDKVKKKAKEESKVKNKKVTVSDITRRALEDYLNKGLE